MHPVSRRALGLIQITAIISASLLLFLIDRGRRSLIASFRLFGLILHIFSLKV